MNYLEQLVSEWYRYKGYFVKENIKTGLRIRKGNKSGGYNHEIDVLALGPKGILYHIEASTKDPRSVEGIKDKEYVAALNGFRINKVKRIYYFLHGGEGKIENFQKQLMGNSVEITIHSISHLLSQVATELKDTKLNRIVPENFPILRTLQIFIQRYDKIIPS
jgi:hypothetical protein